MRKRLLLSLIGLYPRWWQARYRTEFAEMITMLVDTRRRDTLTLAASIAMGALDAQFTRRSEAGVPSDAVLRRGAGEGLVVAAFIALEVFLTNVVFPAPPSHSDGEYPGEVIGTYLLIAVLLAVIGARGQRRTATRGAGAKAGAVAGCVIAAVVMATFLAVDNLFFGTISQQYDKVIAFAASGSPSMRAFINIGLLQGTLVMIPLLTTVGALFGHLGAQWDTARRWQRAWRR
jgi:hypothetical protein